MAFLARYRALRGGDAPGEVEYNFGRAFHHLGERHRDCITAAIDF